MLVAYDTPEFEGYEDFTGQIVIPRDVVATALKAKTPCVVLRRTINPNGSVTLALGNTLFEAVDGTFPQYTRVIPASVSGETADYSIEVLKRAHLAVAYANGSAKAITKLKQNGENAGVVMGERERIICVVMPFRFKDKIPEYNGWVQPERRELAQAA